MSPASINHYNTVGEGIDASSKATLPTCIRLTESSLAVWSSLVATVITSSGIKNSDLSTFRARAPLHLL